jgi:hypothetical protein
MFINKLKVVLGVLALTFGVALAANAQLDNGESLKFTVDHPFVLNGKNLPAGKYVITSPSAEGSSDILALQNVDGKESMLFTIMAKVHEKAAKDSELVFERIDDTYYLTEIRTRGDEVGSVVERSKTEKQALAAAGVN